MRPLHGNVTYAQLRAVGLGQAAIAYRCRTERLIRVHHKVYALGRAPALPLERAAAAVLACGEDAVLSHHSALSLWNLVSEWRFPLHVTSVTRRRHTGVVNHRASGLTASDRRTQLGVPVTSPARTLLDCAPELTDRQLSRLVGDARRRGLLHLAGALEVTERFGNHPGRRPLLGAIGALAVPTRSELEQAFLAFCRRHELPCPIVNAHVGGREVDAWFPDHRLIVELDGWDFHRDRHVFEDDRERDAEALEAGIPTVRITWERLLYRPAREAERLATILSARLADPRGPGFAP